MKMYVLLVAAILFGMVAPVLAASEGDLHGDVGYTYDTMHVWRGYLTYGHHSSSNPFIDLDLFGTGFGFEAIGHYANGSGSNPDGLGYNNEQRWDYSLYYARAIEPEDTLRHSIRSATDTLIIPNEHSFPVPRNRQH